MKKIPDAGWAKSIVQVLSLSITKIEYKNLVTQ